MPRKPPTPAALMRLVEQLRTEVEALKDHDSGPVIVDRRLVDVEKIRFSPRVVVGIMLAVVAVVGGMWAATYGLRSDVRDILTTIANQKELAERDRRDLDRQYETLSKAIDTIDKQQKLQALEIQSLKEMVLRQGVK